MTQVQASEPIWQTEEKESLEHEFVFEGYHPPRTLVSWKVTKVSRLAPSEIHLSQEDWSSPLYPLLALSESVHAS